MPRFHCPAPLAAGAELDLPPGAARHVQVLRLQPDSPRREAIAQGLQVIDKFNCGGCHALSLDRWELSYEPGDFEKPDEVKDFDFLKPHFTPQQIEASLKTDARGRRHATLYGMPVADAQGRPIPHSKDGVPLGPDDTEEPAYYLFMPWENVLLNGEAWLSGVQRVPKQGHSCGCLAPCSTRALMHSVGASAAGKARPKRRCASNSA